jgi:signal transduction histidine kinase
MPASQPQVNILIIYFFYGLAFFSMGLAMLLESRRSPLLAEASVLTPLAMFGLVHGAHEWLELMIKLMGQMGIAIPTYLPWVRLGFLVFSFLSLIVFALQVMGPQEGRLTPQNLYLGMALLGGYIVLVVATSLTQQSRSAQWLSHADVLSRYVLAVPGALLAGLALGQQARQANAQGRTKLARSFQLAAWGFGIYCLTQIFVPTVDLFPARYLNTEIFTTLIGVPIQAIRVALAILITYGLIQASQVVEEERQGQLAAARQARLEALEQLQEDLIEREQIRRDLLRHTVQAQEEERARIARELHDETAQFLTALSLNLAALKNSVPGDHKVGELIKQLQELSRHMAKGIHRMVHDLRPAQLDDLGLVAALEYLVDEEQRLGLEINLKIEGDPQRLDPLIETVLFRVAQEALTNVARHAHCDHAALQLEFVSGQARLQVIDQGVGFDMQDESGPRNGWGLEGMRERVDSIAGELHIDSAPEAGTNIEVTVPITRKNPHDFKESTHEHNPVDAG